MPRVCKVWIKSEISISGVESEQRLVGSNLKRSSMIFLLNFEGMSVLS